ncbi:MAG: lamin tail domain-containing protein [Verrucomicrobia bacterium]|nr:lamin tail domain-containing protein [Verrucomicrobiota bacterium]
MKKNLRLIVSLALASLAVATAQAQPANDNFVNGFVLTGTVVATNGNSAVPSNATRENGEPRVSGSQFLGGRTVWFRWTAPVSGPTLIDTTNSAFNTLLGVYTGSAVNALTQVAANDNVRDGVTSSAVTIQAVEGVTYHIVVDGRGQGFGAASGPYNLNLRVLAQVAITSPTNGAVFQQGVPIPFTVTASYPGQTTTVSRVELYSSFGFIGTVSNAPYNLVVSNAPLGTNLFAAVVYDSSGGASQTPIVGLLVLAPGLTIVSPTFGQYFLPGNPITVWAVPLLSAGTMTNVEFFVDGQSIGQDATSPFSATWSAVTGGVHELTAIGQDDTGTTWVAAPTKIGVSVTISPMNVVWKYLDNGSDQGTAWTARDFNDSTWTNGPAPLGYGDSQGRPPATTVSFGPDANNKYRTTYFRQAVVITNAANYAYLIFTFERDDGIIIYVNGTEAVRQNMSSGTVTYQSFASSNAGDDGTGVYTYSATAASLVEGTNVLAVEIHQDSANSSDIWFQLELGGLPVIPRNQTPVVALVNPTNNAAFLAPSTLTLIATATDSDGVVTNVEFFVDGAKIGETTNNVENEFSLDWNAPALGRHTLTVAASDDLGGRSVSATVVVTVFDAAATPLVQITSPANGVVMEGPTNLPISAMASAVSGITNVEFYAGTNRIGARASVTMTPAADYLFQNSLASAVGTAPALQNLGSNVFGLVTVDGASRTVLRFAENDGLSLIGATGVVPSNVFTAVLLFSFNDVSSWRRLMDFRNATVDDGLYVLNGALQFYPEAGGPANAIAANTFVQVVLTRDSAKNVTGYVNGVQQFTFVDDAGDAVLDANGVLRFFRDDGTEGSAGSVARLRLFDTALSAEQVAMLDRLPSTGLTWNSYSMVWSNAPFGVSSLVALAYDAQGVIGTSAVVSVTINTPPTNTVAPTVVRVVPMQGTNVGTLTNIQVVFSERVVGVDASDFLVNGAPALVVSGSGSNYTFTFPQPPYGEVEITWAADHGITDIGWPAPLPFAGANWAYTLLDLTPPTILGRTPGAGATVTNLTEVSVRFSEDVSGVDASDFRVNGSPAIGLSGSGSNYTFSFFQPAAGTVSFSWAAANGITDLASPPNAFNGAAAGWSCTLDNRTVLVQSNATWLFVKGTNEASTPVDFWRQPGFDDSGWSNAPAPFYYGDPYNSAAVPGTLLSDMRNNYSSVFLRKSFMVPNAAAVTNLQLRALIDDGFIMWINGREVLRTNMPPGDVAYNGLAVQAYSDNNGMPYENYVLPDPRGYLVDGTNVLAVAAYNQSLTDSSDFGFNAQLYTYLADPTVVPPSVASVSPAAGTLFYFTNLTVKFSEPVSGVEAADLLINGLAATEVTGGASNDLFTFSFAQPACGAVDVTWAAGHGIEDFDAPPKAFGGAIFHYTLLNPNAPIVASQAPLAGTSVASLTQITVTFTKPVTNVEAADFRINGFPADRVTGAGAAYTFEFAQPPYGAVTVGWATNHGITDLEAPANEFDPTRSGGSWIYALLDLAPPVVASQEPPAGASVTNLTHVTINFSEAVSGVNANDLLINGVPATGLSVSGAGTSYTFSFAQPNATTVFITWTNSHGIRDLAATPNSFNSAGPGATWSYTTPDTLPPVIASIEPAPNITVRSLMQVRVTFTEPVVGVRTNSLLINGRPVRQVSGSGAGPYAFAFLPPAAGQVSVGWAPFHGITDLALPANPFGGGEWMYLVDPNASFAGKVLINEIMFNPVSGRPADEWIELRNVSTNLINLTGWRFSRGVQFTFPNVSIPAGAYLVVAADVAALQAKYPAVTNVVGGWTGSLANSEETIELVTPLGESVNSVHYASAGDWARRERGRGANRVLGITRSGSTATVTVFGHGYTGTDQILISGADQPEYNGRFTINSITPSTFNITVPGTPATPATGVILCRQVLDNGQSGWSWFCAADGLGSSLELINPDLPNDVGQNWLVSATLQGTPGVANSVSTNNVAPLIQEVKHFPPVPRSSDPVAITARLQDEAADGVQSVTLFYRNHTTTGPAAFSSTNLLDDGAHSDGVARDGLYGVVLPPAANGAVTEFYVRATDTTGLVRTWPAPAWDTNNTTGQFANALYQVDNEAITDTMPSVRLVLSGTERVLFPPGDRQGDAEMNCTMIAIDGDGIGVRYNCGVRIRGAGTRGRNPPNNRLNIPNDNPWNGRTAVNLNGQFIHAALIGNVLAQKSAVVATDPHVVQYRINGVNPAPITAPINQTGNGAGWGTFLMLKPVDGDLLADQYPDDPDGNVYRASTGNHNADLSYYGTNVNTYVSSQNTAHGYFKTSNNTENDWTDLFNLCYAFSQVAADADYVQAISTNVNVVEWMRYFALGTLVNFGETSLFNGRGDDYALYRGQKDRRFVVISHDFDTIFGQGDTGTGYYPINTNASIFTMINPPNGNANVPVLRRFMSHPAFAPIYYRELKQLCDTVFHPSQLNPLFDQFLTGWGVGPDEATITGMKTYAANRRTIVLSQIPLALTLANNFSLSNGLPYTTAANLTLFGFGHSIDTRQVLVNGVQATWSAFDARWTNTVALAPGVNRVVVQALNADGVEFARLERDIWLDDASVQTVSGAITSDTAWTAANGPYQVTANLTINNGATLTIQAGTTIYLASGVNITVANGGRLLADGTDSAHIRFTRVPGGGNWGGITVNGGAGSPETRFAYANFEANGSTAIHSTGGTVFLDHLTFGNTAVQYVSLDGSSFVVQDCVFPTATAAFELVHGNGGIKAGGRGLFLRNFFGLANGYNDVVDFTGGNRPGPILQFLDNVFIGSGDDHLDLDGTDAWIEGNIFLHAHKNGSPDSSSAISGGLTGSDRSEITIVGNLIYDCDQAANAKEGNFYTFYNNTIVRTTKRGGTDTVSCVGLLADVNTQEGAGMYFEGNIIDDAEQLVYGRTNAVVTFTNNLISRLAGAAWTGPGGNNGTNDPLFKYVPAVTETSNFTSWAAAQVLWDWFSLRTGSPAAGKGPNGTDQGIPLQRFNASTVRPLLGASLSGEPDAVTGQNFATLTVGLNRTGNGIPASSWANGSGFTHYMWRLDGGAWSAETPITTPITLTALSEGAHYVEVTGKRDCGFYQDDTIYGRDAVLTHSRTWVVNTTVLPLRLNEILASNGGAVDHQGTTPDVIELHNTSGDTLDLAGVRITDDPGNPDKFIFPSNSIISPGGYKILYANNPDGTTGYHIGFNLSQDGQSLYLYDRPERGGALLDSVSFGPQLTDLSIGRVASLSHQMGEGQGEGWALTVPTFGGANKAASIGDPTRLRINEWLALGSAPFADDFVELYNPDVLPVSLGGLYLSDEIISWPGRHQIAALSFMPGRGYRRFLADGSPEQGPEHLNFRLDFEQGSLGLYLPNLTPIDLVMYQSQRLNVSQGRSPNGGTSIVFFDTPTPGAPNPTVAGPIPFGGALVINEVLADNASFLADDLSTPDWVELYNGTTNAVSLGGFSLTDDVLRITRYVFPAGTTIEPAGYLRLFCDGGLPASTTNTGFGLRATGGSLYLFDDQQNYLSSATVNYGLQLADLSIGRVPDGSTNWVLTSPTPNAANAAVPTLGDPANLRVNEWMAAPASGDDWFEIYNPNTQPVALGGLWLTDDLNNRTKHRIAPLSFIGADTNAWRVFLADGNTGAGADHVSFSLRAAGEAVGLSTPTGTLLDGRAFGGQTNGVSEGRFPDGGTEVVAFPGTESPGAPNYRWLTSVVINEVLTHTDLPLEDAIELHNLTSQDIDVSGWWLSDDMGAVRKYQIPAGTSLPAHGFTVIYETHFTNRNEAALPFALSSKGDETVLSAATNGALNGYRTHVRFGPAANGVSFGRYLNSVGEEEFVAMSARTFGVEDPSNVEQFRLGIGATNAYPKVGTVVLNEIMYHPPDLGTNDNVRDEFIELFNTSTVPVALFDPAYPTNVWHLRDAVDFDFPTNTSIQAGGYLLVVSFDPVNNPSALAAFRSRYNVSLDTVIVGPYSGKLANDTDEIELRRPDLPDTNGVAYILVEHIRYRDFTPWPIEADGTGLSLHRLSVTGYANDPTNWVASAPTPGPQTAPLDTDGDGIPDWWMQDHFGHPTGQSGDASLASQDADNDGMTNGGEYTAGTNPRDAQSLLKLGLEVNSGSAFVSFAGVANRSYSIQFKESPAATRWYRLADLDLGENSAPVTFTDTNPVTRQRLYRVATPSLPETNSGPKVLQSPDTQAADVGDTVRFRVVAIGSGALHYQWFYEEALIVEATGPAYELNNVTGATSGRYHVVVTDAAGSSTSETAVLTVKPAITDQPAGATVAVGGAVQFEVTALGTPPLQYRWYRDNRLVAGQTNAVLTLTNVTPTDEGSYHVVVRHLTPAGWAGTSSHPALLRVTGP